MDDPLCMSMDASTQCYLSFYPSNSPQVTFSKGSLSFADRERRAQRDSICCLGFSHNRLLN